MALRADRDRGALCAEGSYRKALGDDGCSGSDEQEFRKFEEIGTHPAATHNTILLALEFSEQIGAERKFARLRYLTRRWAERLTTLPGSRMLVRLEPSQSGAFGTIHFEGWDPGKLCDVLLAKYNILVTPISAAGVNGVRISPNVFTSSAEIDQLCDAMEATVRKS